MTRRWRNPNEKLSVEELQKIRDIYAKVGDEPIMMDYNSLGSEMQSAWRLPSAATVQKWVQAWKELRKRKYRRDHPTFPR